MVELQQYYAKPLVAFMWRPRYLGSLAGGASTILCLTSCSFHVEMEFSSCSRPRGRDAASALWMVEPQQYYAKPLVAVMWIPPRGRDATSALWLVEPQQYYASFL